MFLKSVFSFLLQKKKQKSLIPDHLSESNIPWRQISSLSSLLLFNSSENAYTIGRPTIFAKKFSQQANKIKSIDNDSQKFSESISISEKTDINDNDFQLTFHTKPEILDDLPAELPSLPGIADEFHFKDTGDSDITDQLNLPDLTLLSKSTFAPSNSNQSEPIIDINVDKLPELSIPVENGVTSFISPPPPPPPPPPSMLDEQVLSSPPVPPPPLPSSSVLSSLVGSSQQTTIATPRIQNSISNGQLEIGRASLLESIRAAGGKPKKKTIKERKHDEKLKKKDALEDSMTESPINNQTNNNNNNKGLDMMSELRKRLESRRSGISSDHQQIVNKSNTDRTIKSPTFDANSAMLNMSALIPPPPPPTISTSNQTNHSSDDDDDKDFEDWD